jgi:hypothetical protein
VGFSTRRNRQEQVRTPSTNSSSNAFRRSRTLTGSISSRVAAAVENVSQLKSPRLEEHELRGHRRKLTMLLGASVAVIVALVWLIDSTIVFIQASDDSPVKARQLALVEEYLQQHPAQRFSFALDQAQLTRAVQAKAPEVASVTIQGDDKYALYTVSVAERTPIAQWKLGQDVYLVDAEGVAYQDGNVSTVGLLQVKDESGLPLASQKVASKRTMQFIGRVVAQLQVQGAGTVVEVILPTGLLKQIDIVLESRPYRIKLHTDRSPEGQAADILATLRFIDARQIVPAYIDARVEGKAFYR